MIHQLSSNDLIVSINSFGAELCSVKNNNAIEFIWQADKNVWARHAPILFPIVGKLNGDVYFFEGKEYQLNQHGFARDCSFDLLDSDNKSCTFQLTQNKKTINHYPFDFVIQIIYSVIANKLNVTYKIINSSSKNLMFSIGAHPAFNIPLNQTEQYEDYYLQFASSMLEKTKLENGLISNHKTSLHLHNKQLPLSNNLFDEDALVFENNQINEIALISSKSTHKITLNCKKWPFFGIWSKKGCKEFVCLEPWYGIADSVESTQNLKEKKGIISLQPAKTFECDYSITFE